MLKKIILLTLKGITHRPTRSWLTILGIVISIMLVVIIMTLGNGIKNVTNKQLQMFGNNIITVIPGKETNPFIGLLGGEKFKEKDIFDLKKIKGVELILPVEVGVLNVEFKGEKKAMMVHATSIKGKEEIFTNGQGIKMLGGKWPKDEYSNEVVFGYLAFTKLFKNKIKIGDEILIKGKKIKISGYISSIGSQTDDNFIHISKELFSELTGIKGGAKVAILRIDEKENINLLTRQIKFQLDKQNSVQDFFIVTPDKVNKMVGSTMKIIELFLFFIAFISLVVGGVGIMNTMYTSVLERTKQVGILKAIGAKNEAILLLFLLESGIIGLVGGFLGIVLGLFMSFLAGLGAELGGVYGLFSANSIDLLGLFSILIITFITGMLSGIFPAKKASEMQAAVALRYE